MIDTPKLDFSAPGNELTATGMETPLALKYPI
jgi:hypothetical protein